MTLVTTLASLPFAAREEVVLRRFGLSTQGWGGWWSDVGRAYAVGLVATLVVLLVVMALWPGVGVLPLVLTFRVRSGDDRRKAERPPDVPQRRAEKKKRPAPRKPHGPISLSVTVSIGIGESQPKLSSDEIIHQADKALYRAKRSGRNRIETGIPERKVLGFRSKKKDS